jgi:hypothetical protein
MNFVNTKIKISGKNCYELYDKLITCITKNMLLTILLYQATATSQYNYYPWFFCINIVDRAQVLRQLSWVIVQEVELGDKIYGLAY